MKFSKTIPWPLALTFLLPFSWTLLERLLFLALRYYSETDSIIFSFKVFFFLLICKMKLIRTNLVGLLWRFSKLIHVAFGTVPSIWWAYKICKSFMLLLCCYHYLVLAGPLPLRNPVPKPRSHFLPCSSERDKMVKSMGQNVNNRWIRVNDRQGFFVLFLLLQLFWKFEMIVKREVKQTKRTLTGLTGLICPCVLKPAQTWTGVCSQERKGLFIWGNGAKLRVTGKLVLTDLAPCWLPGNRGKIITSGG